MRKLLLLLCLPLVAQAAGEGAWQASAMGITLNHRGEASSCRRHQPVQGATTRVAWNIQLNGPIPAGLLPGCAH